MFYYVVVGRKLEGWFNEELKEFKQFATSQELNEESMKEICLRKQNIKNKYFDTITTVKNTILKKSNTLEP